MSMVCPQCKQEFDKQQDCPTCTCRLRYHLSAFETTSAGMRDENWQQTSWGRLAVGLLLAQGLAYGSQHLCTAGFLVSDESNRTVWETLFGLVLMHLLHGMSLVIGAAVSGAGQRRGLLYGSLIGFVHGVVFLAVQSQDNIPSLFMAAVYGQMILFTILGGVGGWLGILIWKPMPVLALGKPAEKAAFHWSVFSLGEFFAGPIHFARRAAGDRHCWRRRALVKGDPKFRHEHQRRSFGDDIAFPGSIAAGGDIGPGHAVRCGPGGGRHVQRPKTRTGRRHRHRAWS